MLLSAAALVGALLVGFGLGRVKNAAKLAAVKAELDKLEAAGVTDVKKVFAAVRSHLKV